MVRSLVHLAQNHIVCLTVYTESPEKIIANLLFLSVTKSPSLVAKNAIGVAPTCDQKLNVPYHAACHVSDLLAIKDATKP